MPVDGRHPRDPLLGWLAAAFPGTPGQRATGSTGGPRPQIEERTVANIKSQIKRNRQNERRRLRNKAVRSEMRTRTKTAVAEAEAGGEQAVETLRAAVKRIDKAAAQGVIHKNQAANRKSRLMQRIAKLSS